MIFMGAGNPHSRSHRVLQQIEDLFEDNEEILDQESMLKRSSTEVELLRRFRCLLALYSDLSGLQQPDTPQDETSVWREVALAQFRGEVSRFLEQLKSDFDV